MVQVKRYLLFIFDIKSKGGWDDFAGSYATTQDIKNALRATSDDKVYVETLPDLKCACWQIVDLLTLEAVESGIAEDLVVQNKPKVPTPPKSAKTGGVQKI